MFNAAPKLTKKGLELTASVASGSAITFTKFAVGSGALVGSDDPANFTGLKQSRHVFGVDSIEKSGNTVKITGTFDSSLINTGFRLRELGVFCKDSTNTEYLFAYANDGDKAGQIDNLSDATVEQTINLVFAFSSSENVTATLTGASAYANREELESHTGNTNNPHDVTKEQIGLGNVPNVTTNNQTPTYSNYTGIDYVPASGEKLSVALGKIKRAVTEFISHLADTVCHVTDADRTAWNYAYENANRYTGKAVVKVVTKVVKLNNEDLIKILTRDEISNAIGVQLANDDMHIKCVFYANNAHWEANKSGDVERVRVTDDALYLALRSNNSTKPNGNMRFNIAIIYNG